MFAELGGFFMKFCNDGYENLIKRLKSKELILFGTGKTADSFLKTLSTTIKVLIRKTMDDGGIKHIVSDFKPIDIENIVSFCVDNDAKKHYTTFKFENISLMTYLPQKLHDIENASERYIIVITSQYFLEIYHQLAHIKNLDDVVCYIAPIMADETSADYWNHVFQHIIYRDNVFNYKKILRSLKNIHKGERCFVIGNGPSLTVSDLDCLKNEYTFAVNRIYMLFEKTDWRPTYYCVIDSVHLTNSIDDIRDVKAKMKFIPLFALSKQKNDVADATYFNFVYKPFYPKMPPFSGDITEEIYEGMTVTYVLLQIAVYMGFSEIYLIGQDHSYSRESLPDGSIKFNPGVVNYFQKDYTKADDRPGAITYMNLSYEKARMYCEEHGIGIYNATRGGKLEIFNRVEFDSLFSREVKYKE